MSSGEQEMKLIPKRNTNKRFFNLQRYYYNNDKPTFYHWLNNILDDVEIIDNASNNQIHNLDIEFPQEYYYGFIEYKRTLATYENKIDKFQSKNKVK